MLRNRKVQIDFVKEKKANPEVAETPGATFEEKAVIIGRLVERSIKKIAIAVVVVVTIDAARRIAEEAVSNQ